MEEILGDMDVQHVSIVLNNQEENGIKECCNGKKMNTRRAALKTAKRNW